MYPICVVMPLLDRLDIFGAAVANLIGLSDTDDRSGGTSAQSKPGCGAMSAVVPAPPNGSRTKPFSGQEANKQGRANASGMPAGWPPL
jgi:hypothetical protein